MEAFWLLFLVPFFATNSLDKAESVQLFDEIFGEGWWDNEKDEEWQKLTLEQNALHQIDQQNTQIGQIEPNSTDQNPPLTESDNSGQIESNSTDQLGTESENEIASNKNIAEDERKRKIVDKFHAIKAEFKKIGKYSVKERNQIEVKIAKHLKVSRLKIYKWKKELEKFDQMKAELTRNGFKNSYPNQINESVAKELGLGVTTIYNWKRELGQTAPKHKYPHSEQMELMKRYYEIKDKDPNIHDKELKSMKFWQLIIILFFTIYLIKNAKSVGQRGEGPKLYKTFDEIFGK
uniref:Transposase n=1 Tax=Globodera rostochiensis TaxID=31243 RepID=A0A914IEY6_GLORO